MAYVINLGNYDLTGGWHEFKVKALSDRKTMIDSEFSNVVRYYVDKEQTTERAKYITFQTSKPANNILSIALKYHASYNIDENWSYLLSSESSTTIPTIAEVNDGVGYIAKVKSGMTYSAKLENASDIADIGLAIYPSIEAMVNPSTAPSSFSGDWSVDKKFLTITSNIDGYLLVVVAANKTSSDPYQATGLEKINVVEGEYQESTIPAYAPYIILLRSFKAFGTAITQPSAIGPVGEITGVTPKTFESKGSTAGYKKIVAYGKDLTQPGIIRPIGSASGTSPLEFTSLKDGSYTSLKVYGKTPTQPAISGPIGSVSGLSPQTFTNLTNYSSYKSVRAYGKYAEQSSQVARIGEVEKSTTPVTFTPYQNDDRGYINIKAYGKYVQYPPQIGRIGIMDKTNDSAGSFTSIKDDTRGYKSIKAYGKDAVQSDITPSGTTGKVISPVVFSSEKSHDSYASAKAYGKYVVNKDSETPSVSKSVPLVSTLGEIHQVPSKYSKLTHIESSGTQVINTEMIPSSDMEIDIDFEYSEIKGNYNRVFGVDEGDGKTISISSSLELGGKLSITANDEDGNTTVYNTQADVDTDRHHISLNRNHKFYIDGNEIDSDLYTVPADCTSPMYIFGTDGASGYATGKLHRLRIKSNTTSKVTHNMIPVKRNFDNVVGLLDTESSKKNLFDFYKIFASRSELYYQTDNGTVHNVAMDNTSWADLYSTGNYAVLQPGTYTMSTNNAPDAVYMYWVQEDNSSIFEVLPATFTITTAKKFTCKFYKAPKLDPPTDLTADGTTVSYTQSLHATWYKVYSDGEYIGDTTVLGSTNSIIGNLNNEDINIGQLQLEVGSTSTRFEPFDGFYGNSGTGSFTAGTEVDNVYTVGDQTFEIKDSNTSAIHYSMFTMEDMYSINDYIDFSSSTLHKKSNVTVLTGTEAWSESSQGYSMEYDFDAVQGPCASTVATNWVFSDSNTLVCVVSKDTFPTIASWKEYLANKHAGNDAVIVAYNTESEEVTEIIESATPSQVQGSNTVTNIFGDGSYGCIEVTGIMKLQTIPLPNYPLDIKLAKGAIKYNNTLSAFYTTGSQTVDIKIGDTVKSTDQVQSILLSKQSYEDMVLNKSYSDYTPKVFTGTESWGYDAANKYFYLTISDAFVTDTTVQTSARCTHFGADKYSNVITLNNNDRFAIGSTPAKIVVRMNSITSVSGFKSWLASLYSNDDPMILIYPTTSINEVTVSHTVIPQYAGVNIIENNTELGIGSVSLYGYNVQQTVPQSDEPMNIKTTKGNIHYGYPDIQKNIPIGYDRVSYIDGDDSIRYVDTNTSITVVRKSDNMTGMYNITDTAMTEKFSAIPGTPGVERVRQCYGTGNNYAQISNSSAVNRANIQSLLLSPDSFEDIVTGSVYKNFDYKVLDGTETWDILSISDNQTVFYLLNGDVKLVEETDVAYCNYFDYKYGAWAEESQYINKFTLYDSANAFIFNTHGIGTTVDSMKSWIVDRYDEGNPVIVIYPKASPSSSSVQPVSVIPQKAGENTILNYTELGNGDIYLYGYTVYQSEPSMISPIPIVGNNGIVKVIEDPVTHVRSIGYDEVKHTISIGETSTNITSMLLSPYSSQDAITGETINDITYSVFTGTENWQKTDVQGHEMFYLNVGNGYSQSDASPVPGLKCSHFKSVSYSDLYNHRSNGISVSAANGNIYLYHSDYMSLTVPELKTIFAAKHSANENVFVIYPKGEYTYTTSQQNIIPVIAGENTVTSNSAIGHTNVYVYGITKNQTDPQHDSPMPIVSNNGNITTNSLVVTTPVHKAINTVNGSAYTYDVKAILASTSSYEDLTNGYIHSDMDIFKFDGSETWVGDNGLFITQVSGVDTSGISMCTHFKYDDVIDLGMENETYSIYTSGEYANIAVRCDAFMTALQFKTFLTSNPMLVLYKRSTPYAGYTTFTTPVQYHGANVIASNSAIGHVNLAVDGIEVLQTIPTPSHSIPMHAASGKLSVNTSGNLVGEGKHTVLVAKPGLWSTYSPLVSNDSTYPIVITDGRFGTVSGKKYISTTNNDTGINGYYCEETQHFVVVAGLTGLKMFETVI